jgi:hypothetical protein
MNSIAKFNKAHENDVVYKPILPYKWYSSMGKPILLYYSLL